MRICVGLIVLTYFKVSAVYHWVCLAIHLIHDLREDGDFGDVGNFSKTFEIFKGPLSDFKGLNSFLKDFKGLYYFFPK